MKKLKRITTAILAVYMLSAAAFAEETHTAQFKVKVDNRQNVTVTESTKLRTTEPRNKYGQIPDILFNRGFALFLID